MKEIVEKYLALNYYIDDGEIFTTEGNVQFLTDMMHPLQTIFSTDEYDSYMFIKNWVLSSGLSPDMLNHNITRYKIECPLPYSEQNFITSQYNHDIMLATAMEIRSNVVMTPYFERIFTGLKIMKELIPFMRVHGFRLIKDSDIDPTGYQNQYFFYRMSYNEIRDERKHNSYWQDWLRAEKHDQEAQ